MYAPYTAYDGVTARPGTQPIHLYLRLSKAHQAEDGADAIERHRIDLTRKLEAEGCWTIMGEYVDNDSASIYAARVRKGWTQLNADIDAGQVRAIAFWKLDRTNRKTVDTMIWLAHCRDTGVTLVSHQDSSEELKYATPGAKLIGGIKAIMAESETDVMSERQLAAKGHSAEAGFNHGGVSPFGWMIGPKVTDKHGRTGTRLVPHPVEYSALREAVTMVLEGKSLTQVAERWHHKFGIMRADGAPVYVSSILRSLRSPRLVGYRMRHVPEHQRGVRLDLMDFIARDASGDPVISQEPVCDLLTWRRVQKVIDDARNSKSRVPWGTRQWLLTGVLTCGTCSRQLHGNDRHDKQPNGEKLIYGVYRCEANRRFGLGSCSKQVATKQTVAEEFMVAWLESYLTTERLTHARAIESQRASSTVPDELDEARLERDALIAQQGAPQYKGAMVGVLLGMINEVQARIDRLEDEVQVQPVSELGLDDRPFATQWDAMTLEAKRLLVRRVVDHVVVAPGRGGPEMRFDVVRRLSL